MQKGNYQPNKNIYVKAQHNKMFYEVISLA